VSTQPDESLLTLSEQELLARLGKELAADELHAIPLSTEELIERAHVWVDAKTNILRATICPNSTVRSYFVESENWKLFTAIIDLVASIAVGVSPVTLSALLIKRGLKNLCQSEWTQDN
jgi:hypothetical protein